MIRINNNTLIVSWTIFLIIGCSGGGSQSQQPPTRSQNPAPQPLVSNSVPVISGTPLTEATINQAYVFQPTASDPDGDNLVFSITNQPPWSSFESGSGRLSGTPAQGEAAVYGNIQISVSDGRQSAALPTFSITVHQSATGTATLSWTAPTTNTNGSALTDLSAYKFYYGTSPGKYEHEIRVDNPGLTTYVIENLTPGTYYFVSTSINSLDVESNHSNEASKTID